MAEPINIFETDELTIEYCQNYLTLIEKLNQEKIKDANRTPTPDLICREMNITMDQYWELKEFAENDFGEWHRTYIIMKPHTIIDIKTGKPIDPLQL